jgi:hypothetical protein
MRNEGYDFICAPNLHVHRICFLKENKIFIFLLVRRERVPEKYKSLGTNIYLGQLH